tara:strand:+ start:180 stop:509 length:330 start_codon:yes stop_codon:yes gene_type:complete
MAVTYTISTLERNTSDDGVVVAHWRASDSEVVGTGDDAVTHSGSSYGTCGFTPDATADGYVAYDSLTEADVIAWVKESMGEEAVEALESSIAAQITASKEPVTAAGVPW